MSLLEEKEEEEEKQEMEERDRKEKDERGRRRTQGGGGGGGALPNGGCLLGVNGARENPERLSHLTYRETAFQHKYSSLQLLKDKLVSEVCFMVCSSYLGNISWSPQLTVMIEHCMILNDNSGLHKL